MLCQRKSTGARHLCGGEITQHRNVYDATESSEIASQNGMNCLAKRKRTQTRHAVMVV
jgi:hypothetical protein